jgi:hypothetical protein
MSRLVSKPRRAMPHTRQRTNGHQRNIGAMWRRCWQRDVWKRWEAKNVIHLLKQPATDDQIQQMLQLYEGMIKIVVDIRRRFLSGGGEMHADCESVLLDNGSEQDDLWGANWYPNEQRIEFESLINIRPRLGNRNILIQDESIRKQVESVTREILGDAK